MVLALKVAFYKVREQVLKDVCCILQSSLQGSHDERSYVAPVTHGEGTLRLQCADESQQEYFVIHQLSKLLQGFLHAGLSSPRNLHVSCIVAHTKSHTHIR